MLLNFQPSNYAGKLAYILPYEKTKLFTQQIRSLISRFLVTFCGQIISMTITLLSQKGSEKQNSD